MKEHLLRGGDSGVKHTGVLGQRAVGWTLFYGKIARNGPCSMAIFPEKYPVLWQDSQKYTMFYGKIPIKIPCFRAITAIDMMYNFFAVIYSKLNPVLWQQLTFRTLFYGICLYFSTLFYGNIKNFGPCFMAISKISDPVLWQNRPKRTLFGPRIVTMTIWDSCPRARTHFLNP